MSFKNYIKKNFLEDPNYSTYKLISRLLLFNFLAFLFCCFLFYSLIGITNDLVQKQNVVSHDVESEFILASAVFDEHDVQTYEEYYRDLEIKIPRRVYVFFGFTLFFMMYWFDYLYFLFKRYIELRRELV